MDKFLDYCYGHIITDILNVTCSFDRSNKSSESLHKLIKTVNSNRIECNYNEEGLLHSKYLDDRYEPAITIRFGFMVMYYYLFDGEIKDCVHPFSVKKYSRVETFYIVLYYSSERIEQGLPIKICEYVDGVQYNSKLSELTIVKSLCVDGVKVNMIDYVKQDYTLHDCMEPWLFKFAD